MIPTHLALSNLSLILTSSQNRYLQLEDQRDSAWLGTKGRRTGREGEAQPTSPAFAPSLVHLPGLTMPFLQILLSPRPKVSNNSSRHLIRTLLSVGPITGSYPADTNTRPLVGSKPLIFSRWHKVFWEWISYFRWDCNTSTRSHSKATWLELKEENKVPFRPQGQTIGPLLW